MITLMSWGHKFGTPEANFKFDVSFLKNPWRIPELRNAKADELLKFMEKQDDFIQIVEAFVYLIQKFHYSYGEENLIFAFCCSAGEYRSPLVVEAVSSRLNGKGIHCQIRHSVNSKI